MKMEDAWRRVDEVANTAVDTFSYCVERGDGIFYPSKVGMRFGDDKRPFKSAITWHAWQSMQSLMDRGLDPLTVLIERAHEKGMDFWADLRLQSFGGMKPAFKLSNGGRGMAHPEVRSHHLDVIRELAADYVVDGVELDFSAAFGQSPYFLRPEDIRSYTPVITGWVAEAAKIVRTRPSLSATIGARVFPTEEMNLAQGLDVRTWLKEGLLDFVIPVMYGYNNLDPDMPIEWLTELGAQHDVAVYGMLQPYMRDESTVPDDRTYLRRIHATPEMFRAAAANFWAKGVDGLYTWFLKWPFGDAEHRILTEIGDPDTIKERSKRYVVRRRSKDAAELGYSAFLPLAIPEANPGHAYPIPFHVADDIRGRADRIRQIRLRINISNVVTQDQFTIKLNGKSPAKEICLRDFGRLDAARDQWIEFVLVGVRPEKGMNMLDISLDSRPKGLEGGVVVEEVELYVEYGPHPSGLNVASE
ncbi:MAG: hypothetical protein FJ319_02555 [SAR202 cluster bacterium]|nr:hypothetical protein [SAR202 cluster bacterium]